MMGTVIWDSSEWSRGHVDLRVSIESSGPLHAFDDRLTLKIDNREREANPDGDFAHQFNYSKASIRGPSNGRFDVKIGGVEAGSIEEPTPQNYRPEQSVPIPITLDSGRHDVTVDGHKIGTVRVYNPDYPPETMGTQPDVTGTNDSPDSGNSETDEQPTPEVPGTTETDEQPDPQPSTETTSTGTQPSAGGSENQQRSTVPTKTVAAAGIAALALLIWAR